MKVIQVRIFLSLYEKNKTNIIFSLVYFQLDSMTEVKNISNILTINKNIIQD